MLQVIGKVSATEKMPSTIDNFYMENMYMVMVLKSRMDLSINQMLKHYLIRL